MSCPKLVRWLNDLVSDRVEAGERTIVPGDEIQIDFSVGEITYLSRTCRFSPLGAVPQGLVVAGGVENQVRQQLGVEAGVTG